VADLEGRLEIGRSRRVSPGEEAGVGSRATLALGHLAGLDREGRLLFMPDLSEGAPVPVAIGTSDSDEAIARAARSNRKAVVAFLTGGDGVLVGLVRARVGDGALSAAHEGPEVLVDGEVLNIRAARQIELRCGKASLVLRADGRVELSGTYVVSNSRGPNKVRGATISLN
jgi:hypothetical protein